MFNNKSLPSKIWRYGAKAPLENADVVDQQIGLAHAYRNNLIERERDRRRCTDELLCEMFPDLHAVEKRYEAAKEDVEDLKEAVRKAKFESDTNRAPKEMREDLKKAKAIEREVYAERKKLRTKYFQDPKWKRRSKTIEDRDKKLRKELRANSGLFWGTYLKVEQDMRDIRKGAPPDFRRWSGHGCVAVQIQHGLTPEKAYACEDSRIRIEVVPDRCTAKKQRAIVWMRVGSEKRAPIWAKVFCTIHRPFPEDCLIKWVYLTRRRVACTHRWNLCFVISRKDGFPETKPSGFGWVGVDMGWRVTEDGIRVATWADDRGESGQVVLSGQDVSRWFRAYELKSQRDRNFNEIRDVFKDYLDKNKGTVPDWILEKCSHLHQWRSQARLAALILRWRDERFDGDSEMFDRLEAWRKQDRHLYQWEANQKLKAVEWRNDKFRNVVAKWRQDYSEVVIKDVKMTGSRKKARVEDEDERWRRRYANIASPGVIKRYILETFGKDGVVLVEPKGLSETCHICGSVEAFNMAAEIEHECENCGAYWDQDLNAAKNLMAHGSGVKTVV